MSINLDSKIHSTPAKTKRNKLNAFITEEKEEISIEPVYKRITIQDFGIYEGQVSKRNLLPNGEGVLELENGLVYTGEFKNGRMHGQGYLEDKKGNNYEGEFKYGVKDGKGVENIIGSEDTGKIEYKGKFKADQRCGYGNYCFY